MSYDYDQTTGSQQRPTPSPQLQILTNSFSGDVTIKQGTQSNQRLQYSVLDTMGQVFLSGQFEDQETRFQLTDLPFGLYIIEVRKGNRTVKTKKMIYGKS